MAERTRAGAASNARAAAAARSRQKSKESQSRRGAKYIQCPYPKLEPKGGSSTTLTIFCYVVKERHHPQGIKPGEIWYRRPLKLHRNIGSGDSKTQMLCPKNFIPRVSCVMCSEADSLWTKFLDEKAHASKERQEELKNQAKEPSAQNRDFMLAYHHEGERIVYLDESYGGGAMRGLGALLDARLANPPSEDMSAFWLDGPPAKTAGIPGEGYALRISWEENSSGGFAWVQPVAIDFIARKDAKVPDKIWTEGCSKDISEYLVKTTSKEIEAAYLELPDEDPEECPPCEDVQQDQEPNSDPEPDEPEPDPEEEAGEEDDIPFDDEPDFDSMDKEVLLAFGAENNLHVTVKGQSKPVSIYKNNKEEDVRKVVKKAWADRPPETPPEESTPEPPKEDPKKGRERSKQAGKPSGACPGGGTFGKDFNELAHCAEQCPQETFDKCADEADKLAASGK